MRYNTTCVFVSFNSAHLLRERLVQLGGLPIVVADNASSDATEHMLASEFPDAKVLPSKINRGYGRAANAGIESAKTPYVLLLNPDVEIALKEIESLEKIAGGVGDDWLLLAPDTGLAPEARQSGTSASSTAGLVEIEAASGAALFLNRIAFEKLGGFDPNIFLFFEETDLCRRARDSQLRLWFAPEIRVAHEIGTSTHRTLELDYVRKWHYQWSLLYFARKHRSGWRLLKALWKNLVIAPLKMACARRDSRSYAHCHARFDSAKVFLAGRGAFDQNGNPYRNAFLARLSESGAAATRD